MTRACNIVPSPRTMFGRLLHAPPLAARAVGGAVAQARRVPRLRVLPGARRVPAVAARAALSTATVASARRGALVCPCTARRFATHAGNDGNSHNHKYVRLFKLPMSSTFADVTRFLSQAGVTPDPAHTAIITGATRAHGSWIIRVPARQQHAVLALHGSVVAGQAVDVRQVRRTRRLVGARACNESPVVAAPPPLPVEPP